MKRIEKGSCRPAAKAGVPKLTCFSCVAVGTGAMCRPPCSCVCHKISRPAVSKPELGPKIVTNEAGGKQSELLARYDIIPPHALKVLAEVRHFASVVRGYPDWNYKLIPAADHLNHAMAHITAHIDQQACLHCQEVSGDEEPCPRHSGETQPPEDHAAHALCRIAMWVEMLHEEGLR